MPKMSRQVIYKAGGVSARGVFNMMAYSGLTIAQSFFELIDNSIDWRLPSKKLTIRFIIENGMFMLMDNSAGMILDTFIKMFILYNEDTSQDGRGGKCGYGSKGALYKLSRNFTIITKHSQDEYYTQITNWEDIETLDGAFDINHSTEKEIELFKKYNKESGTLIQMPLTDEIKEFMDSQFCESPFKMDMSIANYMGSVYAYHNNIEILYEQQKIRFYNPFKDNEYLYDSNESILLYLTFSNDSKKKDMVYWNIGGEYYYVKCGKDCNLQGPKSEKPTNEDTYEMLLQLSCIKPLDSYFDVNHPKLPENTGLTVQDDYRKSYFGDNIHNDINSKLLIVRNNTLIGTTSVGKAAQQGGKGSARDKFEKTKINMLLKFSFQFSQLDKKTTIHRLRRHTIF